MTTSIDLTKMEEVMDFMMAHLANDLPMESMADIFCRLIWCLNDNGAAIDEVRTRWLEGDDPKKVEVALLMSETYPYETREEIDNQCRRISSKWPSLAQLCDDLLRSWDSQALADRDGSR